MPRNNKPIVKKTTPPADLDLDTATYRKLVKLWWEDNLDDILRLELKTALQGDRLGHEARKHILDRLVGPVNQKQQNANAIAIQINLVPVSSTEGSGPSIEGEVRLLHPGTDDESSS